MTTELMEAPTSAIVPQTGRSSVADVTRHTIAVQEVMRAVMKPNVHYGIIPGAGDKPTLLKAGAEVLCLTFKIDDDYEVEDISQPGSIRYRVKSIGRHQVTGIRLGSGMGECSSDEEKYRWRKAVCRPEFDATPPDMRRVKFARKQQSFYTVDQVRTEPADLANTVLKMACKRAKIAMVLNVTGASDMFSQDLDDLDATLVMHLAESDREEVGQNIRKDWVEKVYACKTRGELTKVMRDGKAVFQAARDRDGYSAFAHAITQHGATLPQEAASNA